MSTNRENIWNIDWTKEIDSIIESYNELKKTSNLSDFKHR